MNLTKELWDERYSTEEYIYGKTPNAFFKEWIDAQSKKGKILFVCDGEGRNSVYAAKLGWEVSAFDLSDVARDKALKLAFENNVFIKYDVVSALDFKSDEKYDAIILLYAHFGEDSREKIHKYLISFLKTGGSVILEAFNKKQLMNTSGGPKSESMLYRKIVLENDFSSLDISYLENLEINLEEGDHHKGKADVVRMISKMS